MNHQRLMSLADRMLDLIDRKATDLAPSIMYEPTWRYTSQDLLDRERRIIFGDQVLFLGLSADLPTPGSWRTVDIVDSPLLLVRDESGKARLFLNACRHRGVKLCDGSGEGRNAFNCPFHGWRYDLGGGLINVPEPEGFEALSRAEHGLTELPIAEKYGMLFGSPTRRAEIDVDEVLGGMGAELGEWGFENFSLYTEHHLHPFRGNWKAAWDTFCENYHFAFLHANSIKDRLISRRQAIDIHGQQIRMITALQTIQEMRQLPREQWEPQRHLSIQYRLFPAVNLSVYPDELEVHWIYPGRTPDEGYGIHAVYVPQQPETDEERQQLDKMIKFGCEDIVNAEDFWVTSQTLPGIHAPSRADHLIFGRNEPAVQHFHRAHRALVEPGPDQAALDELLLEGSR